MKNGVINNRFLIVLIIVGIAGAAWAQELPTLTLTSAVETALDLNREWRRFDSRKTPLIWLKWKPTAPSSPDLVSKRFQ